MPSFIQKRFLNSVKIFWLNRDLLIEYLIRCITTLTKEKEEVKKVILFGSVVEDHAVPSSDIDLVLIVSESNERFIDRFSTYIDFFKDIDLDVELFVYTEEEAKQCNIPLLKTAIEKGKVLFER